MFLKVHLIVILCILSFATSIRRNNKNVKKHGHKQSLSKNNGKLDDAGNPLYLTPLIENGQIQQGAF